MNERVGVILFLFLIDQQFHVGLKTVHIGPPFPVESSNVAAKDVAEG